MKRGQPKPSPFRVYLFGALVRASVLNFCHQIKSLVAYAKESPNCRKYANDFDCYSASPFHLYSSLDSPLFKPSAIDNTKCMD